MRDPLFPYNWFWRSDNGRLYSSATGEKTSSSDEAFTGWVEAGGRPSPWPRDDEGSQTDVALATELSKHGIFFGFEDRRQYAFAQIDAAAEQARLKYITPGDGQALTYQEKAAELARYDEDTQPRIAEYPLLAAEIGITADSLKGVADAVRAALASWRQAGAAIERVRLQAKADVEKARDDEAVRAVIDAIEWP